MFTTVFVALFILPVKPWTLSLLEDSASRRTMLVLGGLCWFLEVSAGLTRSLVVAGGLCWSLEDSAGLTRSLEVSAGPWRTMLDPGGLCWSLEDSAGQSPLFVSWSSVFLGWKCGWDQRFSPLGGPMWTIHLGLSWWHCSHFQRGSMSIICDLGRCLFQWLTAACWAATSCTTCHFIDKQTAQTTVTCYHGNMMWICASENESCDKVTKVYSSHLPVTFTKESSFNEPMGSKVKFKVECCCIHWPSLWRRKELHPGWLPWHWLVAVAMLSKYVFDKLLVCASVFYVTRVQNNVIWRKRVNRMCKYPSSCATNVTSEYLIYCCDLFDFREHLSYLCYWSIKLVLVSRRSNVTMIFFVSEQNCYFACVYTWWPLTRFLTMKTSCPAGFPQRVKVSEGSTLNGSEHVHRNCWFRFIRALHTELFIHVERNAPQPWTHCFVYHAPLAGGNDRAILQQQSGNKLISFCLNFL